MMKCFFFSFLLCFTAIVQAQDKVSFVTIEEGRFMKGDAPYYFIGTNYWYGALLASTGEGGDRARLKRELDFLKKHGVDNLRILVGAEGPDNEPSRVTPALQVAPGKYNETLLDGLDYLMMELDKREMKAVLFLNNSWEWSGGYAQYLNWNGYGPIPYPNLEQYDWPTFMKYVNEFHKSCEKCKEQFKEHVRYIVTRTNRYTKKKYIDDPAIMTWEIANEPRAFSEENLPALEEWLGETASFIKSLDPHHLVTTGSEGQWGTEGSMKAFESIHAHPDIDYLTMHIWPKNWQWIDIKNITGTLDGAVSKTNDYIDEHLAVAQRLNKPIVLEEFGLPRDKHTFSLDDNTTARDRYYENAFQQVLTHAREGGVLGGCNFWAFGGSARPVKDRHFWKKGDPVMGDPPQEEQGLNSVFDQDATMKLVRKYAAKINEAASNR